MTDGLSLRGERLLASPPMSPYVQAHQDRVDQSWDPVHRPDGYIALCVAENMLVWDLLEPRLAAARRSLAPEAIAYDRMIGAQALREALAPFLSRRVLGREVGPDQLAVLNGAGSVLELLFHNLCDPGEGVLVPTPSYAGFWADLTTRDEAVIVPVPRSPDDGYALTPAGLEAAHRRAEVPVKALLLTNPDNPLGRVAPPEEVGAAIAWAHERGLHVVLDEVYALSVFGDARFVSGTRLVDDLGDDLHVIWSFSKDLAASGLRTGVLVSGNARLLRAVEELAYWAAVPGDTQTMLTEVVSDDAWVDGFVTENQRRLGEAYARVAAVLDEHGIAHTPSQAGFFTLLDLRPWLDEPTWEAEDRLWSELLTTERVNLTPGSACRAPEPGAFRLVFSCVPTDAAVEGTRRLARHLTTRRG